MMNVETKSLCENCRGDISDYLEYPRECLDGGQGFDGERVTHWGEFKTVCPHCGADIIYGDSD